MSKAFAEKIIDGFVDENGHCGERGLSEKQFDILSAWLEPEEWQDMGYWEGVYTTKYFSSRAWDGNIGKYHVRIQERWHFNLGFNVLSIELRDPEEYEAELEAERKLREMRDFSGSEWIAEPKKRIEITLTLVNDYQYEGYSYSYYDGGTSHIYTFRDEGGNCVVWKTKNVIDFYDKERDEWVLAEIGSKVTMRATVKEHGEYRGTKQTIITRPQIKAIA